MPIYAYRCETCGHAKDVLQKISDPVLDTCPACGAASFRKQLTAAGFQLKGSGWYVTDFRGGDNAKAKPADADGESKPSADTPKTDAPAAPAAAPATSAGDAKPTPAPAAAPAASAPTTPPASAS